MESQNVPSVQCSWEFSKGTTTEDVKAVDLGNSSVSTDRITFIIQSSPHTNVYVSFALSALENLHFPVLSCKTCDVITLPMSLYCWQNAQLFIAKLLRRWSQASSYFCLHSYCFLSRGLSCTLAHKKKKKSCVKLKPDWTSEIQRKIAFGSGDRIAWVVFQPMLIMTLMKCLEEYWQNCWYIRKLEFLVLTSTQALLSYKDLRPNL